MLQRSVRIIGLALATVTIGCHSLRLPAPVTPFEHRIARDQLVLHSDFSLDEEHRLIEELTAQREWLTNTLRLSATEVPIHVYLFADDAAYYAEMERKFPEFANRRAIFVVNGDQLSVYAHWGEHVADDLRHEVSHGYLHAAIPNLPLWLDEGLAEYFEVGKARGGMNRAHVRLLSQKQITEEWSPSLARLEQIDAAAGMTQEDYAEAWAWVHMLLESEHELSNVLIDYLADLRQGGAGALLGTQLGNRMAKPELALLEHLESLP